MKLLPIPALIFTLINLTAFGAVPAKITLQAEDGTLNPIRVELVQQSSFKSGEGVALKPNIEPGVDSPDAAPDLVLTVHPSQTGRFVFKTHAAVNTTGRKLIAKAKSKYESLFMRIAVGQNRATKRVVFVPWSPPESCVQTTGKFDLTAHDQEIRVWLPKGVRLDYLEISPYTPPKVPAAAAAYQPKIVPPASHPRLWVNKKSLPKIQANLTKGTNAPLWKKIQAEAKKPYVYNPLPDAVTKENADLEKAAVNKAFVYLMTKDADTGRQAVKLMRNYLDTVEFGNILDVTREIGSAVYAGARVYDWCYDLMTNEDRRVIRTNLMRLADDMEIGWPPFKQSVVNGHGSEAQLLCHLLSMSIAVYDEDPVPYQYCSYRILEELVPMRNFQYQSPRHSQGIGYGIYRFGWDMRAAWLFYRMTGRKVFDSNIEDLRKYWLYMRLPNGRSFADGDGTAYGSHRSLGALALMLAAYDDDPIMKRDFIKQGGLPNDPIMVLLLNDPDLKPAKDLNSLPLTLDFGPAVGGMVVRTGWNIGPGSPDVAVAMTGGGYYFGNHQHADAGSFQVFFHGMQIADLGEYHFYGTPYDMNFNKRSIAHSMMLAYDPNEKFGGGKLFNDGGARFEHSSPRSPATVKKDPRYSTGKILSSAFGPSRTKPAFSYFSVDLTAAYSKKLKSYIRTFCFLNLEDPQNPAALIIVDHMETSSPEIKKYWQVNTLKPPRETDTGVLLRNSEFSKIGNVFLQMLRPAANNRQLKILDGKDATNVFGHPLTPPQPDAPQSKGHRVMFSPITPAKTDTFLTVLSMTDGTQTTAPVDLVETSDTYIITLAHRMIVLGKTGKLLKNPITVETTLDQRTPLLLTGLTPGIWRIQKQDGLFHIDVPVIKHKNTASVKLPKGTYTIAPKQ